ncbi:hypothetical protein [Paenibacillus tianjinensis]|uniref:Uncharacterized protein n=1 Tax=Paenibacillus tianjinensis TaxID=2810347 RepID=A0ABX7LN16_9BACL|nr:hypothetical protein [Paenibacillus tianjinensis]QSF47252.1 hypothetical protein JRJ22_12165 [Paenibacillus tianjinensis]
MSVDDYLDLLNYAKAINDGQWQADIIESLKNVKATSEEYRREENVRELWNRFDDINRNLLVLFDRLRENEGSEDSYRWKERIWELKMERITIAKQIQERYIKIR